MATVATILNPRKKKNPYSKGKKSGKVRPRKRKKDNWKWKALVSNGSKYKTKAGRDKIKDAMRSFAKARGLRVVKWSTRKGHIVAFLTSSTSLPQGYRVRQYGREGAKFKAVGYPITKRAKAALKRKKKTTTKRKSTKKKTGTRRRTTTKKRSTKRKKGTKVSKKTAFTADGSKLKKGYFIGTGANGNKHAKGQYFRSA